MDIKKYKVDIDKIKKKRDYSNQNLDNDDLQYMTSLSAAVLQKSPTNTRIVLWIGFFVIMWLIIWAGFAEIDEITKGSGKVIPSHQIQVIQNLEGGIVSEIMVKEGDKVKEGQILLKLEDINFASSFEEGELRFKELEAKSIRLKAEALGERFIMPKKLLEVAPELVKKEKSLYDSNQEQLSSSMNIYISQMKQKRNELHELKAKLQKLKENKKLFQEELDMTEPLVKDGLVSEVEYLQLRRKMLEFDSDIESAALSIPRLESMIEESEDKVKETLLEFQNKAKTEWNEVSAEMQRIGKKTEALEDKVNRTAIRSPVNGTVKQLLVNTVSGVVQPGMDIVEIVPSQDTLIIETKIKPQDIAFLYAGQEAMVKFTAYDFSIHGGLKGKVIHISADTIMDEEGNNFYLIRVKTEENHLGTARNPLEIIVGMTADVDILTGKKTILDYMLKPILKAQQNALTER